MNKIKIFLLNSLKKIKNNLFNIVASLIAIYIVLLTSISVYRDIFIDQKPEYEYTIYRSMSELHCATMKEKTINGINNYIDSVAPNSALNGIAIFEACDEYNIDIIFVLSQAQLESHFGTTGIASKTNSVWNVLAYDGRTANDMNKKGHGYDHPDRSIKPYLELLNKNYLSYNITEYDLLKKFINKDGKRYASDKNYEQKLSGLYNGIMNSTNIFNDYREYKKYKMILNVR